MSGVDLRSFVFKSRTNSEGLLARLRSEPAENLLKLNNQDYVLFDAFREKLKENDQHDRKCMLQLQSKQREFRETRLLKQHQATWALEWENLISQEHQLAEELEELPGDWHVDNLDSEIQSIISLENLIAEDYTKFWNETVKPLITLRWDLHFWYQAHTLNDDFGQGDPSEVQNVIRSVHEQHEDVIKKLEHDAEVLSKHLHLFELKSNSVDYQGVPPNLNFNQCPKHLRKSLIDEFVILDIRFQYKLDTIKERFKYLRIRNDGWTDKAHELFKYATNLYTRDLNNYQELTYDLLLKLLPEFTMDELLTHHAWIFNYRHFKDAISAVLSDWVKYKDELTIRTQSAIVKAYKVLQECAENAMAYDKQKILCHDLSRRVSQWRKWKFQKLLLDEECEKQKFVQDRLKQEVMEAERRATIKRKLEAYHKEQLLMQNQTQNPKLRLLALKARKDKMDQTLYQTQRIRFRESQRIANLERRKIFQAKALKKEKNVQRKLERLRQSVSVNVVRDPVRVHKTTVSFNAKRKLEYDEDPLPLLKPLFEVYGFTNNQLAADTRLRLEAKLREANLIHLPYALEVLRKLSPPTIPRPDMKNSFRINEQQHNF